jgi:hypothetical protein
VTAVRRAALGAAALGITVGLAGCVPPLPVTGETRTDEVTRADLARKVTLLARAVGPCPQVESIAARVAAVHPPVAGHPQERQRLGSVEELWEVRVCGQAVTYRITHGRDAQGRALYGYALQRA